MKKLNAGGLTHQKPSKKCIEQDVSKLRFKNLGELPLGAFGVLKKDILTILKEGIISYEKKQYKLAINCFMEVLKIHKSNADAFSYLEKCHKKIDENENNKSTGFTGTIMM